MSAPRKLLVWTENYWIGGCDRFLVDLLDGLRDRPLELALAGNPHPEFDAWLGRRLPWLGPRHVIPVANLVDTPLHRLDRFRSGAAPPSAAETGSAGAPAPRETIAWQAPIASARYAQAALNAVRLRRLLTAARPDALLINNGGYPGGESCRIAALAAREVGVERVVHFVHNMAHSPAWPPGVELALDRRVDAGVDAWVTAAERASDALSRRRGIPRERIHTVHYGLPPAAPPAAGEDSEALRAELGFTGSEPRLAVVANFEPRKGLPVLVRALAALRDEGLGFRTALVGDGPQRAAVEAEIAAHGLRDSIRLLGWRDDVDAIMRQADLLSLPSLANECLPYVILQAMEHGLPVVSTDVAGIPEMVRDGETGFVVAPGDPGALARALAQTVGDRARAAEMGRRGHERLRAEFRAEQMTEQVATLLGV